MEKPKALNATKSEIQKFAEYAAEKLNFSPGGDIKKTVYQLGGEIDILSPEVFSEEIDASIQIREDRSFTIKLSLFTSPLRDRFSIAHEFGHFFLHFSGKEMEAMRGGAGRAEVEANWFAAAFLMNEEIFRQKSNDFANDMNLVAAHFKVSPVAAKIRAKDLRIIE
tara:strand:- start:62 stop:559 length:498 start_codon:yes stop_codon:yes gene_type:complete